MKWFKPRTKARIKLGQHFMGEKTSTTAEGVALYKEWDPNDRTFYYWEEWELRGFNDIDSWVEYDHYSRQVSLYEPIRRAQKVDPRGLLKNQTIPFLDDTITRNLIVTEAGKGTLVRRDGTFSYHIFEGEEMEYAEMVDSSDRTVKFSAERYNDREFDMYRSRVLSKSAQKRVLGRVVTPINSSALLQIGVWGIFGLMFFGSSIVPRSETVCTPRTVSSTSPSPYSTSQTLYSTTQPTTVQDCQTRTVYGFGSSGSGGGVGK